MTDKNEIWQWIMGSSGTTFPWWNRTIWHDSSWDSPGDITLTIDSPYTARPWCLEDETISKRLTVSDVVAAWEKARTECPGLKGMTIEDMDAGSADVVLQYAVLGDCVYG